MTLRKYKVTGSYLDRTYYSHEFDVDDSDFVDEDEIQDYLQDLILQDESNIYHEWTEEGSEDAAGGFSISDIERLA